MVFDRQTELNNHITQKHIVKYAKTYTRYVPIKMSTEQGNDATSANRLFG